MMTELTAKTSMMKSKLTPVYLVLAAAGSSTRMGTGKKKEYLPLGNGTVLSQSARIFLESTPLKGIVITVPDTEDGVAGAKAALSADREIQSLAESRQTAIDYVRGGRSRQESVYNALAFLSALAEKDAVVLIHDAARPFVTAKIIEDVIQASFAHGAAAPAIPAVDTQKESNAEGFIERHLQRSRIAAIQTPQGFAFAQLWKCHQKAARIQKEYTDDTEVWDSFPECTDARKVRLVDGDITNIKITYAKDIPHSMTQTHIGFGTDFHRLVEGRKLYLGGVEIPAAKGELGHSDGDVLLHAIADAVLGASGLGDIGSYFPPSDPKWKDADSALLLQHIWKDVRNAGWQLVNLDCVIELESPKFLPWRKQVIASIARILAVNEEQVFVKAKTNEKLEAVGTGAAVKAYCVCLLSRI